MRINKPNPNWKLIQKDLKAIKQLFGVNPERVQFVYYGKAIDASNRDCIFADSGIIVSEIAYTTRCRSEIKLYAAVDGKGCWIIPDEDYSFDLDYIWREEI